VADKFHAKHRQSTGQGRISQNSARSMFYYVTKVSSLLILQYKLNVELTIDNFFQALKMAKALHSDYFENEGPAHFAQLVIECLAGKTETQLYARTENTFTLFMSNGWREK